MARGIFFSIPLHGHMSPSLPVIRALAERGEEVICYSLPRFEAKVQEAGAQFRAYEGTAFDAFEGFMERRGKLGYLHYLLTRGVEEMLGAALPHVRTLAPDYVVHDAAASWGKYVAQALGVPAVAFSVVVAFNEKVWRAAHSRWLDLRHPGELLATARHTLRAVRLGKAVSRRHGLGRLGPRYVFFAYEPLTLVCTSRYFQPHAESFDERFVFVGATLGEHYLDVDFPWERLGDERFAYVSMGTVFNRNPAFFRTCFEALADFEGRVVVATGPGLDPAALGPAPANFIVQPFVPQVELLQRAEVFVTHAGMSSLGGATRYGVPMVLIPQTVTQFVAAHRVEALEAGLCLDKDKVSVPRLRAAVGQVTSEPCYRHNSARIGQSFAEAGGAVRAAEAILAYVRAATSDPAAEAEAASSGTRGLA